MKTVNQIHIQIVDTQMQIRVDNSRTITREEKDNMYIEQVIKKSKEVQISMGQNLLQRDFSFGRKAMEHTSPRRKSSETPSRMRDIVKNRLLSFNASPMDSFQKTDHKHNMLVVNLKKKQMINAFRNSKEILMEYKMALFNEIDIMEDLERTQKLRRLTKMSKMNIMKQMYAHKNKDKKKPQTVESCVLIKN